MVVGKSEQKSPLGDLLVEMGLVDREQLSLALGQQRATGARLARILAERRVVDEERVAKAISAKLGLEAINLGSLKIHERVLAIIPAGVALKYAALPIAIKRTNQAEFVYVVMADPLDTEAIQELQRASGRQIRILVAPASEVDRALETHYRVPLVTLQKAHEHPPAMVPPLPGKSLPMIQPPPAGVPVAPAVVHSGAVPSGQMHAQAALAKTEGTRKNLTPSMNPPVIRSRSAPQPNLPQPVGVAASPGASSGVPVRPKEKGLAFPPSHPPSLPPIGIGPPPAALRPMSGAPLPAGAARVLSSPGGVPRADERPPPIPSARSGVLPPLRDPEPPHSVSQRGPSHGHPGSPPPIPSAPPSPRPAAAKELARDLRAAHADGEPHRETRPFDPTLAGPHEGLRVPAEAERGREAFGIPPGDTGDPNLRTSERSDGGSPDWDMAVRDWGQPSPAWPEVVAVPAAAAEPLDTPLSQKTSRLVGSPEPSPLVAPIVEATRVPELVVIPEPQTLHGNAGGDIHVEIVDAEASDEGSDGPEDIKTSQVELSELSAAEIRTGGPAAQAPGAARPDRALVGTLEVPIEYEDQSSPFEGPDAAEIPTGLERTGIIPAIDWETEGFLPPPLARSPAIGGELVGMGDIPLTSAAVRARFNEPPNAGADDAEGDGDDAIESIVIQPVADDEPEPKEEVAPAAAAEPPKKRRSDPPVGARGPARSNEPPSVEGSKFEAHVAPASSSDGSERRNVPPAPVAGIAKANDLGAEVAPEAVIELGPEAEVAGAEAEAAERAEGIARVEDHVAPGARASLSPSDDSDSEHIPVIEPSSLVSLIDEDVASRPEDTGYDEAPSIGPMGSHTRPSTEGVSPHARAPNGGSQVALPLDAHTTLRLVEENARRAHSPARPPPAASRVEAEEVPTNPRIEQSTVKAALGAHEVGPVPQIIDPTIEGVPVPRILEEHPHARDAGGAAVGAESAWAPGERARDALQRNDPTRGGQDASSGEAQRLVEILLQGDSLNSAERAELLLAISRLLLRKGFLSRDDLVAELIK